MTIHSTLILLALLGGLVLRPATVNAQQAHDHAEHGQTSEGRAHAGHDHGTETDKHADADDHDDHAGHGDADEGHDDHAGHGEEEDEGGIRITPEVMREFGIEVQQASGGIIEQTVRLPGEVVYNADRIAHVTPMVSGIVRRVLFTVGDIVEQGSSMAVLDSRELAATRSEYLAAKARLDLARESLSAKEQLFESRIALAQDNVVRDQRLFDEKVGTERQLLEAKQALQELKVTFDLEATEARQAIREARIGLNQTENALYALGYSQEQVQALDTLEGTEFNTYELVAPLSGIVTRRHTTVGEVVAPTAESAPFVVADLSTVWVNLTVYQRDLAHVEPGQPVDIQFGHAIPDAQGTIAFVSPALDETTRTATARIVLENPDGHWRPGLFVTGRIETGHESTPVVVPRSAITELDGKRVVFVQTDQGFEPRQVSVGRTTSEKAEILRGLKTGERYVVRNLLVLKAELNRAALEHAGHVH